MRRGVARVLRGFVMLHRTCVKCKRDLPIWMFAAVPFTESGFDVKCTECAGFDREKFRAKTGYKREFDYFWTHARVD